MLRVIRDDLQKPLIHSRDLLAGQAMVVVAGNLDYDGHVLLCGGKVGCRVLFDLSSPISFWTWEGRDCPGFTGYLVDVEAYVKPYYAQE
jgi:hypothetical protein